MLQSFKGTPKVRPSASLRQTFQTDYIGVNKWESWCWQWARKEKNSKVQWEKDIESIRRTNWTGSNEEKSCHEIVHISKSAQFSNEGTPGTLPLTCRTKRTESSEAYTLWLSANVLWTDLQGTSLSQRAIDSTILIYSSTFNKILSLNLEKTIFGSIAF